jgi:hypothetical protein
LTLTNRTPAGTWTGTGTSELAVVPSPSCPLLLAPQVQTEPLARIAMVWPLAGPLPPWNTWRTAAGSSARTGMSLLAVLSLPSWPAGL